MKDKDKELKYEIYLIDMEIRKLKKQKKIYVDELRAYENNRGFGIGGINDNKRSKQSNKQNR